MSYECPQSLEDQSLRESTTLMLDSKFTIKKWAELILEPLRDIEYFVSQLMLGKSFSPGDIKQWQNFNELDDQIRDGHIDSTKYDKLIAGKKIEDQELLNAFFSFSDIRRLFELMRLEILHSEDRLKEAVIQIRNLTIELSKETSLYYGKEFAHYSSISDRIGWSISDAIKAVFTSLDAVSKLVCFVTDMGVKKLPKIRSVYDSDLANFKPQGNYMPAEYFVDFSRILNFITHYILFRNELTHNQALHSIRQPVFIGVGTPCVGNVKLAYGDILSWERTDGYFTRAHRRVGFFSQKRTAITDAMELIKESIQLIGNCIKIIRLSILQKLRDNNIHELFILKYKAGDLYFQKENVSILMQSVLIF